MSETEDKIIDISNKREEEDPFKKVNNVGVYREKTRPQDRVIPRVPIPDLSGVFDQETTSDESPRKEEEIH